MARKTRIDTRFWGSKMAILGLALCCSACASTLDSGWTPFQLALFSPLQTFPEEVDVRGLRTNLLYGDNADFRGVDFGLVGTANSTKGVQSNFFYNEAEELSGLQLAGIVRNLCVDLDGVQAGTINTTEGQVRGWQLGFLTNEAGNVLGGQVAGISNRSRRVIGLQISALVNEASDLRGLQIGALNFNANGIFPFFPIFNFGFGSDPEKGSSGDGNSSDTE